MNERRSDSASVARWSGAQWWMLIVSCMAVALVVAAMAALYSALPQIAVATRATQAQLTWIVDGYTLVLACFVLPAGAIGDRYGRRGVLVAGLALFAFASALPLFLADPAWLIAARALAGAGAALVMPSTLSILTAGFPPAHRGRAVGVWAGVAGSGAVLGILGAGVLLEQWSWTSVFVGLTVAGAVLAGLACSIAESRQQEHPPVDWVGAVTVVVAVGAIVFAVIEVPARGWSDSLVAISTAVGLFAVVVFVVVELRPVFVAEQRHRNYAATAERRSTVPYGDSSVDTSGCSTVRCAPCTAPSNDGGHHPVMADSEREPDSRDSTRISSSSGSLAADTATAAARVRTSRPRCVPARAVSVQAWAQ